MLNVIYYNITYKKLAIEILQQNTHKYMFAWCVVCFHKNNRRQLKKCLDILATDNETVTDLNEYYLTHQEELAKMISILNPKAPSMLDGPDTIDEDDEKEQPGRLSIHSLTGSMSLFQDDQIHHRNLRHLSEDQTDLNKLLNRRDDDDDDSDSSGTIRKIKKIKTNFFTKKFSKRKRNKKEKQDDQISIKSNSSDTSRISLIEIKNELKKRFKKPKIQKALTNPDDEGVGMASILARSVIHAHTSLACITETQDSEQSAQENMRRTSESEPKINASDDEQRKISIDKVKNKMEGITVPDIQFSSLKNVSSEGVIPERVRKTSESCPSSPVVGRTENLLKLPGDKRYFGSIPSALSGDSSEAYSSSEEEDESSELKTDSDEGIETTASVVNSVLNHEVNPAFIAQMGRKLTTLETIHPTTSDSSADAQIQDKKAKNDIIQGDNIFEAVDTGNDPQKQTEIPLLSSKPSTSAQDSDKCVSKHSMNHIKLHNPFAHKKASKSFSAPSSPVEKKHSFVYRSSKRIKHQLAKLSNSSMIKSISHYSLLPKKKGDVKNHSQPGSSSNVPSRTPSDTVLGSLFLSYSDLLSLDKEGLQANRGLYKSDDLDRTKVSMYIGSEPASRASLSGPSFPSHFREEHGHIRGSHLKPEGLIHTAMETILIDKVDTLLIPTSPDPISKNNKQFFDDVSVKLEEHKNRGSFDVKIMNQVQASTSSTTPRIVAMTPKRLSDDFTVHAHEVYDSRNTSPESKALAHTAVDKSCTIHHVIQDPRCEIKDSSYNAHQKSKHKDHNILNAIKTTLKEHHVNLDSVFSKHHGKKETSPDCKSGGLVHTAMQTMLMDRAQSVMPDTPEPIPIRMEPAFERSNRSRKTSENSESSGMVHSAMQTILMDKFRAVIPNTTEPIPIHLEESDLKHSKKNDKHVDEACGLVHSAMQTILIDKVQTVLPDTKEPVLIHIDDNYNKSESDIESQAGELSGLTQSAVQTMLIEKVQTVLPDTIDPIPIHLEDSKSPNHSDNLTETDTLKGLVHSALETILIEKVQSELPDTSEPIPIHVDDKSFVGNTKNKNMEPEGLLVSGAAILLDKVQTLIVPETSEVSDIIDDFKTSTQNVDRKSDSKGLVKTAMETMVLEKVQTVYPNSTDPDLVTDLPIEDIKEPFEIQSVGNSEGPGVVKTAMQTNLFDKVQNSVGTLDNISLQIKPTDTDLKSPASVETAMKTILLDKSESTVATTNTNESYNILKKTTIQDLQNDKNISKFKKLIRQDSIHSMTETKESIKMSNEDPSNINTSYVTRPPVLQNFHPILSGLETIPSMSESSFERSVDGESSFETNSASVCDNSHAACGFGRSERDRDRSEKDRGSPRHARHESYGGKEPVGSMLTQPQASLNSTSTPMGIHRRSSDSDLSVTPKGETYYHFT